MCSKIFFKRNSLKELECEIRTQGYRQLLDCFEVWRRRVKANSEGRRKNPYTVLQPYSPLVVTWFFHSRQAFGYVRPTLT